MELDKRIINGKRPLTCFDVEEAEKYIGKLCYMCDEYDQFHQLNLIEPTILKGVEDCEIPFHYGKDCQAEFCLPCEWVTKQKRYRPFTLNEFLHIYELGDIVTFKRKYYGHKFARIVTGYETNKEGDKAIIHIGCYSYLLSVLFADYERLNSEEGEWVPFGVEVTEWTIKLNLCFLLSTHRLKLL